MMGLGNALLGAWQGYQQGTDIRKQRGLQEQERLWNQQQRDWQVKQQAWAEAEYARVNRERELAKQREMMVRNTYAGLLNEQNMAAQPIDAILPPSPGGAGMAGAFGGAIPMPSVVSPSMNAMQGVAPQLGGAPAQVPPFTPFVPAVNPKGANVYQGSNLTLIAPRAPGMTTTGAVSAPIPPKVETLTFQYFPENLPFEAKRGKFSAWVANNFEASDDPVGAMVYQGKPVSYAGKYLKPLPGKAVNPKSIGAIYHTAQGLDGVKVPTEGAVPYPLTNDGRAVAGAESAYSAAIPPPPTDLASGGAVGAPGAVIPGYQERVAVADGTYKTDGTYDGTGWADPQEAMAIDNRVPMPYDRDAAQAKVYARRQDEVRQFLNQYPDATMQDVQELMQLLPGVIPDAAAEMVTGFVQGKPVALPLALYAKYPQAFRKEEKRAVTIPINVPNSSEPVAMTPKEAVEYYRALSEQLLPWTLPDGRRIGK